jgi:chaperonin GroES
MKFRPLHDRVVIKLIEAAARSAGGIIIPDTAKEKPQQGEVVAVGPGGRDESGKLLPIDLKVGDRVLRSARSRVIFIVDPTSSGAGRASDDNRAKGAPRAIISTSRVHEHLDQRPERHALSRLAKNRT